MKITKNWFYCLKEIKEDKIIILPNLRVSMFNNSSKNLNIRIWENSKLDFFGVIDWEKNNINFLQIEENSKLKVRYLLLSKNNYINTRIYSEIWANEVKSDLRILSIIWDKWFVDLDWIMKINKKIKWVIWNLKEDNIFLWNSWKVNWIPTLLVRSNDVNASHSCKIERISDEKLFYLRSRWIWKNNALNMMIDSYINELFSGLEIFYKKFFDNFINWILKKIK